MSAIPIPDSNISVEFQIDELTNGSLSGTGVFDVMIKGVKAHLREEFDAGRIRGTDYANVFSLAITQVMDQATNYALAKAKLGIELQLLEAQLGKLAADTVLVTKQCTLTEAQALNQTAQTASVDAQTRQTEYVTSFEIPSRVEANEAQTALTLAQELQTAQQTLNISAQRSQILAQTLDVEASTKLKKVEHDIQTFNKEFKLPRELEIMTTEVSLKESQLALSNKELIVKQAQVDLADKEIQVKQNQIELGTKELLIKEAQVGISEKELLIKGEQLLITKYELTNKLPADVALTNSQAELYTQKTTTEKAQTDPIVIKPKSVIDINNGLIQKQGDSFLRSAEQNTAKLMIDTWNVRHTADPDGNLETAPGLNLKDADVGKAVRKVLEGINVSI